MQAGYTPLHVACHFGQINMVRLLLDEGSKVTSSTAVGYTPLHQAAQQGHCGIINVLLQNGAPPNATTNVSTLLNLFSGEEKDSITHFFTPNFKIAFVNWFLTKILQMFIHLPITASYADS